MEVDRPSQSKSLKRKMGKPKIRAVAAVAAIADAVAAIADERAPHPPPPNCYRCVLLALVQIG